MPDSRRSGRRTLTTVRAASHGDVAVGAGQLVSPITAAAQLLADGAYDAAHPVRYDSWQDEAWTYYESLGELFYGTEWRAQAVSRVRLLAAEVSPAGDEPVPLESGPACDLVTGLAGGADAQSQLLRSFEVHLSVPGDCFLVGRELTGDPEVDGVMNGAEPDDAGRVWSVQPAQTLRPGRRTFRTLLGKQRRGWEMQVDDARWVPLPEETLITRVWNRHERWPWRAMSPTRAALPILREIDMYNRHIIASLISRVALNGILLIPEEVTLPVNERYENATDPFMAELIDIMRNAIKNPGSPAAAAPLPLRVPGEQVERFKHLTFATPLDDKIWTARAGAVDRLATTLNMPKEILTGMGDANHWTGWQLEESAIKTHIAPGVEVITHCLTTGYLQPLLRAGGHPVTGPDGGRVIVWYDTSELTQRPDRSAMAVQLRDRYVISDAATRRETGFDEADAPTADEVQVMALQDLVKGGGQLAGPAYEELTGEPLGPPPAPPGTTPATGVPDAARGPSGEVGDGSSAEPAPTKTPVAGPPDTRGEPPPPPDQGVPASVRRDELIRRVNRALNRPWTDSPGANGATASGAARARDLALAGARAGESEE